MKLSRICALGLVAVLATAMLGCDDHSSAPQPQQTVAQGATPAVPATTATNGSTELPPAVQQATDDSGSLIKANDLSRIFGVSFTMYAHYTFQRTAESFAFRGGTWDIVIITQKDTEAVNGWARLQSGIADGTLTAYRKVPTVHPSALLLHGSLTTIQVCLKCTKPSQAQYLQITANTKDTSADPQLFKATKLAVSRMQ